jgi:secreted PhoX family phosphatase
MPNCWTTARCTWRALTPTASGQWLPLTHGQGRLTAANGFADQGEVLIKARQASDLLGATKMDRPEWLAIDESTRWVYCTLTNNSDAASAGKPGARRGQPARQQHHGPDHPLARRGRLLRQRFEWNHLLLAGDPANDRPKPRATSKATRFPAPTPWPLTRGACCGSAPMSPPHRMGKGEMARLGNNQLLACNPDTGEVRRFLTGPVGCELTGATFTPDGRTCLSTSSIRVKPPANAATQPTRAAIPTGPTSTPWAGRDRGLKASCGVWRARPIAPPMQGCPSGIHPEGS